MNLLKLSYICWMQCCYCYWCWCCCGCHCIALPIDREQVSKASQEQILSLCVSSNMSAETSDTAPSETSCTRGLRMFLLRRHHMQCTTLHYTCNAMLSIMPRWTKSENTIALQLIIVQLLFHWNHINWNGEVSSINQSHRSFSVLSILIHSIAPNQAHSLPYRHTVDQRLCTVFKGISLCKFIYTFGWWTDA